MISYLTFEGDSREAADFIGGVWQRNLESKITFPKWDSAYFDWELLGGPEVDRSLMVAAFDEGRLIGCLLSKPAMFELFGEPVTGAISSWLTVEPAYSRRGVARAIVAEVRRRMEATGCRFLLGFGISGPGSHGTRFWASYRDETTVGPPLHWWARPLEPARLASGELAAANRMAMRLLAMFGARRISRPDAVAGVRPHGQDDLQPCLLLADRAQGGVDFRQSWSLQTLSRQLAFAQTSSSVVQSDRGTVTGCVNYHRLPLVGRREYLAGVIDLVLCDRSGSPGARPLLTAALDTMQGQGLHVALVTPAAGAKRGELIAAGFLPLLSYVSPIYFSIDPTLPFSKIATLSACIR